MGWPVQSSEFNVILTFFGAFMTLFTLVSLYVGDSLNFGPSSIGFIVGIIFGPKAAGILDPFRWNHIETIVLETSRVVLAVQCFANGIDLPKAYVERHWKSIALIIGPVMLAGWLTAACFVKVILPTWDWRQCLACAACFNSIDPVLAATVLSKKFSKRIPKHLRDVLRSEAASNGMTTTIVLDLATSLVRYRRSPRKVAVNIFSRAIPYEAFFGAVIGLIIGYAARLILKYCERKGIIDRQSFLAYYLSVAVFCIGLGTLLGVDEILLAFFAGTFLDNDNWYEEKTRETHLAGVIDLLLNLTYFAFLGSVIPWGSFNSRALGLVPWRLVLGTLCIFLFRRIPMVLLFKPLTPDIKTWREALFYGHFGPIGAGAIFSALLIRGKLTPGSQQTVDTNASDEATQQFLSQLWAVVTFVVLCSTILHGLSIPLFRVGQHVNTLTLTMSYTRDSTTEPSWMDRLPRLPSRPHSFSGISSSSLDDYDPSLAFSSRDIPKLFLGRQNEHEDKRRPLSGIPNRRRREHHWDAHVSAITPGWVNGKIKLGNEGDNAADEDAERHSIRTRYDSSPSQDLDATCIPTVAVSDSVELYEEGDRIIVEDEDGNVIEEAIVPSTGDPTRALEYHPTRPARDTQPPETSTSKDDSAAPLPLWRRIRDFWTGDAPPQNADATQRREAAHAYQFGNTIIIEDEEGNVVKKYTLPAPKEKSPWHLGLSRSFPWMQHENSAMNQQSRLATGEGSSSRRPDGDPHPHAAEPRDIALKSKDKGQHSAGWTTRAQDNPTVSSPTHVVTYPTLPLGGGQRLSTRDFIQKLRELDPKSNIGASEPRTQPAIPHISVSSDQETPAVSHGALRIDDDDDDDDDAAATSDHEPGFSRSVRADLDPNGKGKGKRKAADVDIGIDNDMTFSNPQAQTHTRNLSIDRGRRAPPQGPQSSISRPLTPRGILRPATPSPSPSLSSCRKSVRFSIGADEVAD